MGLNEPALRMDVLHRQGLTVPGEGKAGGEKSLLGWPGLGREMVGWVQPMTPPEPWQLQTLPCQVTQL